MPTRAGRLRFAVLGAGNGGQAMAGHIALQGHSVRLHDIDSRPIEEIRSRGGIEVSGAVDGFARLHVATTDVTEAVQDADVIMVVTPATSHAGVARSCAPHLKDGQIMVLNPGSTMGAIEVLWELRRLTSATCMVAEAQTLVYACRAESPGRVKILGVKQEVPVAALPAGQTAEVLRVLNQVYPQFRPHRSVWQTSLSNVHVVVHAPPTLLNAGRIEAGEEFEYYREAISPAIARLADRVDAERLRLGQALSVPLLSTCEWYRRAYGLKGQDLGELVRENPAYVGIKAPSSLKARYITEDVPCGVVPMLSLARTLGVGMPALETVLNLANLLLGVDFWSQGRRLDRYGLAGAGAHELVELADTGRWPGE